MKKRDYYEVLGVTRNADSDEIKSAFRRIARKLHPDVNQDDADAEERFKELGEAYAVLSDDSKRREYDQFGEVSDIPMPPGGFADGIGDIFDLFFGAGAARRSGPRVVDGQDLEARALIELKDVIGGARRTIELTRLEVCPDCDGSGAAPGTSPISCRDCGGSGVLVDVRSTFMGQVRRSVTCHRCGGEGKLVEEPCPKCEGRRTVEKAAKIEVRIPPGVEHGTVLHLPNQGDDGLNGGRTGDVYVLISVEQDARFKRDEHGLLTQVTITFPQAALGATLDLEGIDSGFVLEIPAGTQPGHIFRVRGQGVPLLGQTERGDLRVRINVDVPRLSSEYQRQLLEAYQKSFTEGDSDESKGFLKDFLSTIQDK